MAKGATFGLGDEESDALMEEAQSSGKPWYAQAWFTKIVSPIVGFGLLVGLPTLALMWSDIQQNRQSAAKLEQKTEENAAEIKQMQNNRREFERQVLEDLSSIETEIKHNSSELSRLRKALKSNE